MSVRQVPAAETEAPEVFNLGQHFQPFGRKRIAGGEFEVPETGHSREMPQIGVGERRQDLARNPHRLYLGQRLGIERCVAELEAEFIQTGNGFFIGLGEGRRGQCQRGQPNGKDQFFHDGFPWYLVKSWPFLRPVSVSCVWPAS